MEATDPKPLRAVIFAGGHLSAEPHIEPTDLVIAADSGYDLCHTLGFDVDLIVGDLDSITAEGLARATEAGVPIDRYPTDKDASDLELALQAAVRAGAMQIAIYGGEGGRGAHLIAVALGLASRAWEDIDLSWHIGNDTVHPVLPHRPLSLTAPHNTPITILPVGDATGVTTIGLRWRLEDDALPRGTSRGLSNIVQGGAYTISLTDGALLVIVEGPTPP
ncbi:MAG: thiamine diphosphokinase [Acidimicrobiia bacterium]|nr:MAG: thiamine diphosphokinase [Acidimicrobiia bacterium]